MSDVTQKLADSTLLDFIEKRWARVEMLGDPIGDAEDSYWQVTPERYNAAYTGEGGTLRDREARMKETPKDLDAMAEAVLSYRPKPKSKAQKRRARKA